MQDMCTLCRILHTIPYESNTYYWSSPKIFLKLFLSCLIYLLGVTMIYWKFCKTNWPEPTCLVHQNSVQDKCAKIVMDFAGISSCVKHSNINTMLFWLNNRIKNIRFVSKPYLECLKPTPLVRQTFVWDRWFCLGQAVGKTGWFLPSSPVVPYIWPLQFTTPQ
jgi:hypothetical protein